MLPGYGHGMSAPRPLRYSDDLEKLRDELLNVLEHTDADEVEPGLRSASRFFMIPTILVGKSPDGMPVSPELQQKREERARWALSELARIYLKFERWGPDMQGRAPRAEKVDFARFGPFAEDARDFWPAFPMFMAFYSASKDGVGAEVALVMWRELQFALMLTRPGKYAKPIAYQMAWDLVKKGRKPPAGVTEDEIVDEVMARLAKRQITLRTYVPEPDGDMLGAVARVRDYWFRAMGRESTRARATLRKQRAIEQTLRTGASERYSSPVAEDYGTPSNAASNFPDPSEFQATPDDPSPRTKRRNIQRGLVDPTAPNRDKLHAEVYARNRDRQRHVPVDGKLSLAEAARKSGVPRTTFIEWYRAAVTAGAVKHCREGRTIVLTEGERKKIVAGRRKSMPRGR